MNREVSWLTAMAFLTVCQARVKKAFLKAVIHWNILMVAVVTDPHSGKLEAEALLHRTGSVATHLFYPFHC